MEKKGFTLVEMMVIVIIIGILGAISAIRYSEYVNKARVNNMVTTIRRIADAQVVYNASNNVYASCANDAELKSKLGVVADSDYFSYTVEIATDSSHYNIVAEVITRMGEIPIGQQVIISDTNTAKLLDPSKREILEYAQSFFNNYTLEN